jgi:hypothetical protein
MGFPRRRFAVSFCDVYHITPRFFCQASSAETLRGAAFRHLKHIKLGKILKIIAK